MTQRAYADDLKQLMAELAGLPSLLPGTVSTITRPSGKQYYSLQCWDNQHNRCQYIPADKVAAVRQATANHRHFQQIMARFAALLEQRTRETLALLPMPMPTPTTLAEPDSKKNSARVSRPRVSKKSPG